MQPQTMANTSSKVNETSTRKNSYKENWIINMEGELNNPNMLAEEKLFEMASICKVPDFIRRDLNPRAFTPQFVSFGPFHNGNKKLEEMEGHKVRALHRFVQRANKNLRSITEEISKITTNLLAAYSYLDEKWKMDGGEFLPMMISDGIFMLEIVEFSLHSGRGYSDFDPIFSLKGINETWAFIKRDMLLIENQVPLFLLKALLSFQPITFDEGQLDYYINKRMLSFVNQSLGADESKEKLLEQLANTGLGLHALDLYRRSLLNPNPAPGRSLDVTRSNSPTIRSAVELAEAGVHFKSSKSNSLDTLGFDLRTGEFHLPYLVVDNIIECTMLNVIAFERFHATTGRDVTFYFRIMNEVVRSGNDVRMLGRKNIIKFLPRREKEVTMMFNNIMKNVIDLENSLLHQVRIDLFQYCSKRRHGWRAYMRHIYLQD